MQAWVHISEREREWSYLYMCECQSTCICIHTFQSKFQHFFNLTIVRHRCLNMCMSVLCVMRTTTVFRLIGSVCKWIRSYVKTMSVGAILTGTEVVVKLFPKTFLRFSFIADILFNQTVLSASTFMNFSLYIILFMIVIIMLLFYYTI